MANNVTLLRTLADLVEQALNNWSGEVEEWDRRARVTLKEADDLLTRPRRKRPRRSRK